MPGFGWVVDASVRFTGNAEVFMTRLTGSSRKATEAINANAKTVGMATEKLRAYASQIGTVINQHRRMVQEFSRTPQAGMMYAAAGATGMGLLRGGANRAGTLELTMAGVGMAAHLNPAQQQQMLNKVFELSHSTAQDATVIAQEMLISARAGLTTFNSLRESFPNIAKLADVLKFLGDASAHPISPVEAASVGVQFAHYFGAYGGKKQEHLNDYLVRLMMSQPEDINRLLTQGKYFIPLAMSMAPKDGAGYYKAMETQMTLLAMMGQVGMLRGRSGTGIEQMDFHALNTAVLTGHLQGKQGKALKALGLIGPDGKPVYADKDGNLDEDAIIAQLALTRGKMKGTEFVTALKEGMGAQASQVLAILASPAVKEAMQRARSAISDKHVTVDTTFDRLVKNTYLPALSRFGKQFDNIWTTMIQPALPKMAQGLNTFADLFAATSKVMAAHPEVAMKTLYLVVLAVGYASVKGAQFSWGLVAALKALGQSAALATPEILAARAALHAGGVPGVPGGGPAGNAARTAAKTGINAGALVNPILTAVSVGLIVNDVLTWMYATHPEFFPRRNIKGADVPTPFVDGPNSTQDEYIRSLRSGGRGAGGPTVNIEVRSNDPHTKVTVKNDPRTVRAPHGKTVTGPRDPNPQTVPLHR